MQRDRYAPCAGRGHATSDERSSSGKLKETGGNSAKMLLHDGEDRDFNDCRSAEWGGGNMKREEEVDGELGKRRRNKVGSSREKNEHGRLVRVYEELHFVRGV